MFGTARVAAFNGRNSPPHFFWGDIAQQLGRADVFQEFWASGPKAPDEKAWIELFFSRLTSPAARSSIAPSAAQPSLSGLMHL